MMECHLLWRHVITTYFFDSEQIPNGEPKFKCCPPIREAGNRELLWQALKDGVIDLVVSDHSPCTADLKGRSGGNYLINWGGISSLQYGLSILHTEALKRGVSLAQINKWMSLNTAKLLGLETRKGKIQVGYDGDLIVFDPTKKFTVETKDIRFKNKLTAYEKQELTGKVIKTILRGKVICDDGRIVETHGPQGNLLCALSRNN